MNNHELEVPPSDPSTNFSSSLAFASIKFEGPTMIEESKNELIIRHLGNNDLESKARHTPIQDIE